MRPFATSALRAALVFCCLLGSACPHQKPPVPTGFLLLQVSPTGPEPTALLPIAVLIDDRPVLLPSRATPTRVRLAAGPHRIEAKALHHFPSYRDVEIKAGAETVVSFLLRKDPDAQDETDSVVPPVLSWPRTR